MNNSSLFNIDLIKLDQIIVTNATINNPSQLSILENGKHEFQLTYNFLFGHKIEEKKFRLIFSCETKTLNEHKEEIKVSAKFDIAFLFSVENLNDLITRKSDSDPFLINNDLITSLANLAYSTSRGIIFTKCQGTIMKNLIIPILSTQKVIEIFSKG